MLIAKLDAGGRETKNAIQETHKQGRMLKNSEFTKYTLRKFRLQYLINFKECKN